MHTYHHTACEGCGAPMPPSGPTTGSVIGTTRYACHECVAMRSAAMDRIELRCHHCGVRREPGDGRLGWSWWCEVSKGPYGGRPKAVTCPTCAGDDTQRVSPAG
jgi:hypothetical protein